MENLVQQKSSNLYKLALAGVAIIFIAAVASLILWSQHQPKDDRRAENNSVNVEKELAGCQNELQDAKDGNSKCEQKNAQLQSVLDQQNQAIAGAGTGVDSVGAERAVQIAIDFINRNALTGSTAKSQDISDSNGLYKFKLSVQGKTYDAYVTKDAKILFAEGVPTAIKLGESTEKPSLTDAKADRPDVKLFVMSYCPYGLQAEKMYLPVYDLLKNKADLGIYFVDYAMHGKKEIDENLRQYCIQKEQTAKFGTYVQCFVQGATDDQGLGQYPKCLVDAGIDQEKLSACIAAADKQFNVTADYDNKSTWMSGSYPKFEINKNLCEKYNVQGSPTIIINGTEAQISSRTPAQFLKAVCNAFKNPPAECSTKLSDEAASSGFGSGVSTTSGGGCGG